MSIPPPREFPAAWADLGNQSGIAPADIVLLDEEADVLTSLLEGSNLPLGSQEHSDLWNQTVRESDRWFRLRFGSRAWMRHHIAAHHLASAQHQASE